MFYYFGRIFSIVSRNPLVTIGLFKDPSVECILFETEILKECRVVLCIARALKDAKLQNRSRISQEKYFETARCRKSLECSKGDRNIEMYYEAIIYQDPKKMSQNNPVPFTQAYDSNNYHSMRSFVIVHNHRRPCLRTSYFLCWNIIVIALFPHSPLAFNR